MLDESIDFIGMLDRLEVALQRCHKHEVYSARRHELYFNLAKKQLDYLRLQWDMAKFYG
ncbi:MAG: hypothetical protein AAF518_06025 [Spirochaetota bacterium]